MPSELCTDEQFIRRVSLDITGTLPTPDQVNDVPRRQGRGQARQADRSPARIRRNTATTSPTSGPTSCASSAAQQQPDRADGTFAFHDWIREAIAAGQAVRRVRPRNPGRDRRRDQEPADRLVQGPADARAVRGRHRPGVPRPAHGLCPVPSPSLREVEPGRLLGPGRLLRPRRPQERRRCPAASSNQTSSSAR